MNAIATTALALVTTLFAAGCGSSDSRSLISNGRSSLGSGDARAALALFEEALSVLGEDEAAFVVAKLGEIEALIALDALRADAEFLALANARSDRIGEGEYIDIAGKLANGGRYEEALEITHAGIERFGAEATRLKDLNARIERAADAATDKEFPSRSVKPTHCDWTDDSCLSQLPPRAK